MIVVAVEEKKPEPKPTRERLQEAVGLPRTTWRDARKLARQLKDKPILPLIGAGASCDCGMEVASPVAKRMYQWYAENNSGRKAPSDLRGSKRDLGAVADAIYAAGDQEKVVEALGLKSRTHWPDAHQLPEHFCAYRVLARLAREDLIAEAITLNYDCCFERGLEDEGFQFAPWELHGRTWLDHATVVADGAAHVQLEPRGQLALTKAHGCAAGYRRAMKEASKPAIDVELRKKLKRKAEDAIVIRRGQLMDWRSDFWARDLFADRARRHVVLLLGASGQDPVIHIALTRVLEEVYRHLGEPGSGVCDEPRVVAIDRRPNTVALNSLIHEGCGRREAGKEVVTSLRVPPGKSMAAVLTAIAVEMLALRLSREAGVRLPKDPQARVTSMMITVPASLRWTYLLERRRGGESFLQRANLEYAGKKGYVPLRADSGRVARSLELRRWLRGRLSMEAGETVAQALAGFGFIVSPSRGCAFMPLGVSGEELRAVPDSDLIAAASCLSMPAELETVLVARTNSGAIGRVAQTGREVAVP